MANTAEDVANDLVQLAIEVDRSEFRPGAEEISARLRIAATRLCEYQQEVNRATVHTSHVESAVAPVIRESRAG